MAIKGFLISLLLLAACTFTITDTRTPQQAAATRTAISRQPVSGNVNVLRVRLLTPPPVTVEPKVLP